MTDIDDVGVGDRLEGLEKTIERVQMFRYSAITWNPRMIHFDAEYTKEVEGHPDVLVHATLHGASIQQLLMDWLDSDGELVELSYKNVDTAFPETPLSVEAEVTTVDESSRRVEFDVWTHQNDRICADGSAAIEFHA